MKWNIMITHQTPELARAGKVGVVAKYEFEGTEDEMQKVMEDWCNQYEANLTVPVYVLGGDLYRLYTTEDERYKLKYEAKQEE